jgi:spermidine synthase
VLFIGSGCSALIYEIVWFQLLQLVIGSSAVSLGVLLGTFMGGMCLGSLALPRLVASGQHPLRVYALLEAGIGLCGLLILFGMPHVDQFYGSGGQGPSGLLLRGLVGAICLLPPTLLMGATLPAVARATEATPEGVSWLGFFYGGNIAGAVFGCLLAGFYLLRVHDMATAVYVAAAINGAVALASLGLAWLTPLAAPARPAATQATARAPGAWAVYVVIALSGLTGLAAEVIWTRLLSLMLGATVYTFSIILAVFLVGLGLGSSLGAFVARQTARPRRVLGACQLLLAAAMAWSALIIARSLPYWPITPWISTSPWFNFQLDLARCFWAILPGTILWGMSFPLALASVATPGSDPGRLVGGVYAANTVGAILGALGASLFFIPTFGTQNAQRALIVLAAVSALLLTLPLLRQRLAVAVPLIAVAVGLAGFLTWSVPGVPGELIAYGRRLPLKIGEGQVLFMGEGLNSSVAVTELSNGVRNFHVSGKVEASTEPQDMRLQRMLGHISALYHDRPRSVLVVGCGAGVTAGSFVTHPELARLVICEIEPLIPQVVAEYFAVQNHNVLRDPRLQVVYDDARHFIRTTPEKFDVITSDPIHPWVKGAASLYTKEYFELCKSRLKPGGLVTQWVPLSTPSAARSPPSSRSSLTERSGATTTTARVTTSCCWARSSRRRSRSRGCNGGWSARSTPPWSTRWRRSASAAPST